jgi:ribonucleoside-diphosphate reductase alpha chain
LAELNKSRGGKLSVDMGMHHGGLDWDKLRTKVKKGMRNATLMAVAPNANIGLVAGTVPGMDARFAQVFARSKFSGKYMDININLVDELKALNLWDTTKSQIIESHGDIQHILEIPEEVRTRYKTSFDINPKAVIEVTARAQKWIDQAISRNMYLETRENEELSNIYSIAWEKGLKSTYYAHVKPRHSAEQSTIVVNKRELQGRKGFALLQNNPTPTPLPISKPTITYAMVDGGLSDSLPEDPALLNQCDGCQ